MILQQPFAIPRASTGFVPTDIAGCRLWLRAGSLALNQNDPVSIWTDESGNGQDVTQTTSGSKPLYKTSVVNGLPAVLFDGVDDFMSGAATDSGTNNSQFIVTQPTLNTSLQKKYACMLHYRSRSFMVARLNSNFWGTYTGTDLSSGNALSSGSNYLLECTTSPAVLYQRGVQVASSVSGVVGPGSSTQTGLGKDLINSNRQYAGHIAEVIFYDSILSSSDRSNVENYLISKYSL